ncbi:MAG: hypothetical protein Q8L85_00515 [Alphaproteobacteria bacterium]|nr:hypothetical protein [Alphaproteobacteria bacterium]
MHKINWEEKMRFILVSFFILLSNFNVQANIKPFLEKMCQISEDSLSWIMELSNNHEAIDYTLEFYKKELVDIEKEVSGKNLNELQSQVKNEQFAILKNKMETQVGFLIVLKDIQTLKIIGSLFIEGVVTCDNKVIWHLRVFGLYNKYKKYLNCIKKTFSYVRDVAKNVCVDKIVTLGMQDDKFIINLILMRLGFDEDLNYFSEYKIASYEKYFSMDLGDLN